MFKALGFLRGQIILSYFWGTNKRRVQAPEIEADGRSRNRVIKKLTNEGYIETRSDHFWIADKVYDEIEIETPNLSTVWATLVQTNHPEYVCTRGVRFFELPVGQQKGVLQALQNNPQAYTFYLIDGNSFWGYEHGMARYTDLVKVCHDNGGQLAESFRFAANSSKINRNVGIIFIKDNGLGHYISSYLTMRIVMAAMTPDRVIEVISQLPGMEKVTGLEDCEALSAILNSPPDLWLQNLLQVIEQSQEDMQDIMRQVTTLAETLRAVTKSEHGCFVELANSIRKEIIADWIDEKQVD